MAESSAKQDRADRKLAKYISRRSLAIGIALLAVVFVTAIIYGAGQAPTLALVFLLQLCKPESEAPAEAAMQLVIRKFSRMRTVHEAARRAESGIGKLMKEASGFRGYYIFDAGGGVAGSVTLFETREAAEAANEKALTWIRGSLGDLIDGDPEVIAGEVLAAITP